MNDHTSLAFQSVPAKLPESARQRLRMLQDLRDDLLSFNRGTSDDRQALIGERSERNARVRRLQAMGLNPSDEPLRTELREAAELSERLLRIQQRLTAKNSLWEAAGQLCNICERFVQDQAGPLDAALPVETNLKRGETVQMRIDRLHLRLRELEADRHRISSAPYPAAYAKQRICEQIDALADRGRIDVSRVIEADDKLEWPMAVLNAVGVTAEGSTALSQIRSADTPALFAWVHRDALLARLNAEVDAVCDDQVALSVEERAKKLAQIQGDALAVEREEAAHIWLAIEQGAAAMFRIDADPRAILGVI